MAQGLLWNPYDGHILNAEMEQVTVLLQELNVTPKAVIADKGFRGADAELSPIQVVHRGKSKRLAPHMRKCLKRRQAIEPVI